MTTDQIDYSTMPARDRMKMVGDLYVKRDIGDEIHRCFDERREESQLLPEPEGVLIVGDTGTGKTSLLENYQAKNPAARKDGVVRRPFLLTSIPPKASMNSLATTMLKHLGDPSPHSGNLAQKTDRVQTQLKLQQVELVAFDEFQHMVEAIGKDGLVRVSDWIKAQMKGVGIPFAICGLPHTDKILAVNRQLARLCPFHYSLGPFAWSEDTSRKDFRMFLGRIDKRLPFNQRAQMADPDLAMRIFAATEGRLYRIAMLIRTAAFRAIRMGSGTIELQHFEYAYDVKVAAANLNRANPFMMNNKGIERALSQLISEKGRG